VLDEGELSDAIDALDDLGELEASLDSAMDMVTDVDVQKKEANILDSNAAEKAPDNEIELESVAGANDVPDLLEVADELTFDEPAADDLRAKDVIFEANDDLVLDEEPLVDLDVDSIAAKVDTTETLVESIAATGHNVENDLFSGLDENDDVASTDDDWLSDFSDEISSLDDDPGELDDSELFSAEDEVGTKLDLARAYIDMGDNESAKGILDEIVTDGNDDQKKDANELIERLA